MEDTFNPQEAQKELAELMEYKMPFGKFKNQRIINLPVDRKSTRLNSSHSQQSRMPSSA